MPRVGVLSAGPLAARTHRWDAFRQRLRELGYTEGQNILIVIRAPAQEGSPLDDLAADLARANVNVIVVQGVLAAHAAKRASPSTPIVMAGLSDPVGAGLVRGLAHPGGNVTGVSMMSAEISGKRLELLRELAPSISRVGVLWNPSNPVSRAGVRETEAAARTLGLRSLSLEVRQPEDLATAFRTAIEAKVDSLVLVDDRIFVGLRAQVADFALKNRLPTIYGSTAAFAEAGGLAVYGPNDTEYYRHAAGYVDKILKGAKPADLPVEQPTKFELVINLKTAKALGLTIPPSLLGRADQVIE